MLRYYEYISDTKLDLLSAQIPAGRLSRLATELKIDAKLVSVTISTAAAAGTATRYDKLRLVEKYLDRHENVGAVTSGTVWFRGDMGFRSQVFGDRVVYAAAQPGMLVVLIGSAHHLIGSATGTDTVGYTGSHLPSLTSLLRGDEAGLLTVAAGESGADAEAPDQAMSLASKMQGPRQQREFLARQLLRGTANDLLGNSVNVSIGSPLYVALTGSPISGLIRK
jgi:hypothetical protein